MALPGHDLAVSTAENYRAFAGEARGRSPQYEELASGVAGDQGVLAFLATLPAAKRQPNLLFAAARYLLGEAPDLPALRALVSGRPQELSRTMLARRTQTNEPARCATLLPAFAALPPPLALIEVGASAGLTCCPTSTPTTTATRQIAGTDPQAPSWSARRAARCRCPRRCPTSPGGRAWT